LVVTTFTVFRRKGAELQPLTPGPNGYACSEGDFLVFEAVSGEIPVVTFSGETLAFKTLQRTGEGYFGVFERLIDMWAGRTSFSLRDGETEVILTLDIGPHEGKLDRFGWEGLINELSEISQSLPWGLSPGAAAGRISNDALTVVHPAIIESELSRFQRLLAQLLADPPIVTLRTRTVRPLDLGRRVDLQTIRWLSRRPLELAGVRGTLPDTQHANSRARINQPSTLSSSDHPITRYVAYLLEQVRRRLMATQRGLTGPAQRRMPDETADTYARQLAAKVSIAVGQIEALQGAPLFRSVRREPLTDSVLQSLPDHPLYSALHRSGRRLAEPGLAYGPAQDLYSALKHSFDLFELVVLYRLASGISSKLGSEWRLLRQGAIKRLPREDRPPDGALWLWAGPEGQFLELHYQPWFSSARAPPDNRRFTSLSAVAVPDYVLVLRQGSNPIGWIILDAKYRSGSQSVRDGLSDVHRYRDALRVRGLKAEAGYIIVPNLQPKAELFGSAEYLAAYRFGALNVYAGEWLDPIFRSLANLGLKRHLGPAAA
jgi:hypothetical protein